MKGIKLAGYIVLLLLAVFFFRRFHEQYTVAGNLSASRLARADGIGTVVAPPVVAHVVDENAVTETNAPDSGTNASETTVTNQETAPADLSVTNALAASNSRGGRPATGASADSSWAAYLGAFFLAVLSLGGLTAWDFAQFVARKGHSSVFEEDTEVKRDPEYEEAEKAWSNGEHLEAVRLMREFLKKNPAEQYASLRIAEIYEKDLHNPLAAAMEYEEILCCKLPREKWGWTAIHLANLYSGKLNQLDKALALLNRVIEQYPETSAARKARSRMGLPEVDDPSGEVMTAAADTNSAPEPFDELPSSEPEPPSSLPPGFRPRK